MIAFSCWILEVVAFASGLLAGWDLISLMVLDLDEVFEDLAEITVFLAFGALMTFMAVEDVEVRGSF